MAALVHRAEVAGVQPAIGIDGGRRRLRVVEIAARHRLAAHHDFARLPRRDVAR